MLVVHKMTIVMCKVTCGMMVATCNSRAFLYLYTFAIRFLCWDLETDCEFGSDGYKDTICRVWVRLPHIQGAFPAPLGLESATDIPSLPHTSSRKVAPQRQPGRVELTMYAAPGFLKGYVRRFAQKSHDHRGTPEVRTLLDRPVHGCLDDAEWEPCSMFTLPSRILAGSSPWSTK